jgi:hypothetical protein
MHVLQVSAVDLLAPQSGGHRLEDHFSLLQDKLHDTDLYDMLRGTLRSKNITVYHLLVLKHSLN